MHKPNSIFEAASSILFEAAITDPKILKLIAAHEAEKAAIIKQFYEEDAKIDAIKAQAKKDIAVHKKARDKVTDDQLALIKKFQGEMDKLGYVFHALGGWAPKK